MHCVGVLLIICVFHHIAAEDECPEAGKLLATATQWAICTSTIVAGGTQELKVEPRGCYTPLNTTIGIYMYDGDTYDRQELNEMHFRYQCRKVQFKTKIVYKMSLIGCVVKAGERGYFMEMDTERDVEATEGHIKSYKCQKKLEQKIVHMEAVAG